MDTIGDFIACAISNVMLTCGDAYSRTIKGNQAGLSEAEMLIPLILIRNEGQK